eukprot:351034-Chlamydomonas_euryale.AAC.8
MERDVFLCHIHTACAEPPSLGTATVHQASHVHAPPSPPAVCGMEWNCPKHCNMYGPSARRPKVPSRLPAHAACSYSASSLKLKSHAMHEREKPCMLIRP